VATQAAHLESVLAAVRQIGLKESSVILLGDERRAGFRHWTEIAAEGEGLTGIAKPPIDPKKDVAYLVYSSVRQPVILYCSASVV
jgi:4-coumarate--CoA ligase